MMARVGGRVNGGVAGGVPCDAWGVTCHVSRLMQGGMREGGASRGVL
jgi:hypothetical protein